MLREKLEKRKAKRAQEIEKAAKERELRIIEAMQEKSQQTADELEAAQTFLAPVYDEENRLNAVNEILQQEMPQAVKKVGTSEMGTGTDPIGDAIESDPEIMNL